jgi:hypothetical protein
MEDLPKDISISEVLESRGFHIGLVLSCRPEVLDHRLIPVASVSEIGERRV